MAAIFNVWKNRPRFEATHGSTLALSHSKHISILHSMFFFSKQSYDKKRHSLEGIQTAQAMAHILATGRGARAKWFFEMKVDRISARNQQLRRKLVASLCQTTVRHAPKHRTLASVLYSTCSQATMLPNTCLRATYKAAGFWGPISPHNLCWWSST